MNRDGSDQRPIAPVIGYFAMQYGDLGSICSQACWYAIPQTHPVIVTQPQDQIVLSGDDEGGQEGRDGSPHEQAPHLERIINAAAKT